MRQRFAGLVETFEDTLEECGIQIDDLNGILSRLENQVEYLEDRDNWYRDPLTHAEMKFITTALQSCTKVLKGIKLRTLVRSVKRLEDYLEG